MTKQQIQNSLQTQEIPCLTHYIRDPQGRPIVTLVAIGSNIDQIGVAYCSRRDTPCKAFGRNLALIRVINGKPWYNVPTPYRWYSVVDHVHAFKARAEKYFQS